MNLLTHEELNQLIISTGNGEELDARTIARLNLEITLLNRAESLNKARSEFGVKGKWIE